MLRLVTLCWLFTVPLAGEGQAPARSRLHAPGKLDTYASLCYHEQGKAGKASKTDARSLTHALCTFLQHLHSKPGNSQFARRNRPERLFPRGQPSVWPSPDHSSRARHSLRPQWHRASSSSVCTDTRLPPARYGGDYRRRRLLFPWHPPLSEPSARPALEPSPIHHTSSVSNNNIPRGAPGRPSGRFAGG